MLAVDGHKKSAGTLLLACAILGALAAVLFGLSPAQAHTNTAFAFPVTNGFYTAWDGDVARINETGTPNCSPGSSLVEATSNDRESFDLDLSTVPNGATVTGVNVTTNHRSDSTAGGTFQTFLRVNGTDVDNGSDIITQTASGSACGLQTSQFLPVTPFVKAAGTDLEIGVLKSDTNTAAVRVGLIRVAVRYNRAPSAPSLSSPANASTTNDRTPAFDWNDDSVDPDGSDGPLTYEINRAALVSGTCDWPNGTINAVSASTFTPGSNMSFGTHCWRVRTLDHDGLAGAYSTHRTITIQQSDVSAVITAADKVYDGDTDAEYTCDVVGEQSGDNVTCDGTHPATFDTATAGTGKTVTATGLTLSGADAGNYNLTNTTDEDTADIEKKTLSVNAVNNSKTYGEDDPTFAYTVTGFVSGENAMNAAGFGGSASCTRAPGNDVGTYTITCAPGTLTATNYSFTTGTTGTLTIDKADPNCSIDGFTGPYDGESHGAAGSCTGVNDEELDGLELGDSFTNVPGGTANWTFTDETGNYNDDSGSVDITINKADPNCSIDGSTVTYDGDPHGASGTCAGVNGEGPLDGLDLGDSFTNVPGGTANWSFTDETGNYSDDSGAVSIVINEAAPTCTIDGFTGPYDGDPHGAAGSCTGVNDEVLDGLDLGASFTNVPGGTANWSFTDETGNYSDDSGSVEIVITSVEVSAEITAQDKPYDGLVDAQYTCDVVGEVDGADVDCDGAHPAMFEDANVGTDKEVTATELVLTGGDAGNYTLINLTDTDEANITAATLSVNADNKTKEFGDDDPLLTYTLTGFIAPDDAENVTITGAGECTREAGESVADSPYEINCTPGNLEADNYTFVTGSVGEFTITPDTTVPSVTIDQALSQDDPTTDSPIVFDVVFSEDVTGFEDDDVELSGSAGATTANVTGDGAEYTVSVSGMTSNGDVIADVKAAAATDGSNDSTASTSDDNTVTYNLKEFDPGPTATISGSPRVGETLTAGEGSPLPAPDSFEYEWFADGSPIAGADDPTFTPTTAEVGKAITVTVTAVKGGYADASDTSDPTSPVGTLGPKTLLVKAQPVALAGDRITIRVARLAPREAYTLTFDGEVIKTGKANVGGTVAITFLLPLTTQPGEYTVTAVGSLPDRTGTDVQLVRAPSALGVLLTKPSVPAGGTQRVQVNDLLHGESVEIRYDGTLVSPSSAKGNSVGRYALTFPVGTTVGSHTVEVKGLYDGRTTTKTFEVTGP